MAGFGLGSANPATPPPGLPLGASTWSPGGWWDLISLPGNNGDPVTAAVASLAGSNVLTPLNSPLVNRVAIGGNRGAYVQDTGVSNTEPMFRVDALASYFTPGAALSLGGDWRQTKQANMPWWQARSGTGGVTDFFGTYIRAERLVVEYRSVATGLVTLTGTIPIEYEYHRLAVRLTGTQCLTYVDGVQDINAALTIPTLNVNRFAWLGSFSTVGFEGATGDARRFYMSPSDIGSAGVATVDTYLVGQDYTLPGTNPLVPEVIWAGASILVGSTAGTTGAGYRAGGSQAILDGRLSWRAVGDHPQGFITNRATPAQSGQSASAIAAQVANFVSSRTKLVVVDFGNQEINIGQNAAQVLTAIATNLAAVRASVYAVAPLAAIVVMNLCPYSEAGFNAVVQAVNPSLPGLWDASDASFSSYRKLLRAGDFNLAIGGPSYVQANYVAGGNDHPNQTGYDLLIPALLAAANSDGDTLPGILALFSPT